MTVMEDICDSDGGHYINKGNNPKGAQTYWLTHSTGNLVYSAAQSPPHIKIPLKSIIHSLYMICILY